MRDVIIPDILWDRISDIRDYLIGELKLSEMAAQSRIRRMEDFITNFANAADYPKCRFKKWRVLGYRCAVFEKDWIFAYEVFDEGIIIRDMSHSALLADR